MSSKRVGRASCSVSGRGADVEVEMDVEEGFGCGWVYMAGDGNSYVEVLVYFVESEFWLENSESAVVLAVNAEDVVEPVDAVETESIDGTGWSACIWFKAGMS